jgi:hypothetical protein
MSMEIPKTAALEEMVFSRFNADAFPGIALEVFLFQYRHNELYRAFCDAVRRTPAEVTNPSHVPFLPISFFKNHQVTCGSFEPALIFESSGTTGLSTSRHLVKDAAMYEKSFRLAFEQFYGPVNEFCVLGLLPSYLERSCSSLVFMVKDMIQNSGHPQSGFYLHNHHQLADTIRQLESAGQKTLLIGVTYALLDFAHAHPMPLSSTLIMETGGMKGRKQELVRSEVHHLLRTAFGVDAIHSEYGMTELLSQAYSKGAGEFKTPPWMKVLIRDETDPFALSEERSGSGGINVIDLANLYSCSFIATEDAGRLLPDGSFEVLGRLDHADVRGCSLLSL